MLAGGEHRDLDAVERAVQRLVLDAADAEIERGFPCGGKFGALGVAAEQVGAFGSAADLAGGVADAAEIRQRRDEGALDFGFPAVVAVSLARDGGEGG